MFDLGPSGGATGASPSFPRSPSSLFGGGIAGLASLLQGQMQAGGFGDLEEQLRKAISMLGEGEKSGIGFLAPFQQFGLGALGTALPTLQQLVTDPTAVRGKLLEGFGQDPGEESAIQEGLRARQAAASASGTLGTSGEATAEQQFAQQQKQRDLANFLAQQGGLMQTGLTGLQGIGQQGLTAGGGIANLISQLARAQAEAQAGFGEAQLGESESRAGGFGKLISDITSFF
jgi:hypothetical protein